MQRTFTELLVLALALSATTAARGQDKSASPVDKYQALLKERDQLPDQLSKAKTPEERKELRERIASLPRRFLELAEKNPKDPNAAEALIQTVALTNGSAFPTDVKGSPGNRALEILMRDHVQSDKIGRICQLVAFGFHKSHETFLRKVLENNNHHEVQGLACLSLAEFLTDRMNRLDVLKDQDKPEMAERYERVFGKEFLGELQRQDRAAVTREIESLFDRAADKYADVKIPVTFYGSGDMVGEKAREELFRIRNLSVGKVAPDIEGEDQDGKRFKLSDYRGKVVLLDIWYHL